MFRNERKKRVILYFAFLSLVLPYFVSAGTYNVNYPDFIICNNTDSSREFIMYLTDYGYNTSNIVYTAVAGNGGTNKGYWDKNDLSLLSAPPSSTDCDVALDLVPRQYNFADLGSGGASSSATTTLATGTFDGIYLFFGMVLFIITMYFVVWTFRRRK